MGHSGAPASAARGVRSARLTERDLARVAHVRLIGIGEAGAWHAKVLAPLAGAAVAFVVFMRVETRVERPLLPVWLFRDRRLVRANLASFVLGFSGYSSLFFLSLFLQQAQGRTPAEAGWQLMPQFVMTAITSMLFGRIAARIPCMR